METHFARLARAKPLDQRQRAFVVGSLLGDGTLLKTTAGWCFRVHHGLAQEWYVNYKHQFLAEYVRSLPRRSGNACYFRTVTLPELSILRDQFYSSGRKTVPGDLLRNELTAFGLSIWIMDDGSADGRALRLNTQSFSYDENCTLAALLWELFGLEARVNRDKSGFRLRIAAGSRERLLELIGLHLQPRMAYKLSQEIPNKTKRPLDHC